MSRCYLIALLVVLGCQRGAPRIADARPPARTPALAVEVAAPRDEPIVGEPVVPPPTSGPATLAAPQAPARAAPVRPAGAVELAVLDPSEELLELIVGVDHVYWTTRREDRLFVERAPRSSGAREALAELESPIMAGPVLAVAGSDAYIGCDRAGRAAICTVREGRVEPLAWDARGVIGGGLLVDGDVIYWVAQTPIGPGPVLATRRRTGATTTLIRWRGGDDYAEVLPGGAAVAVAGDRLVQLTPKGVRRLPARCPCGQVPSEVVAGHVRCEPTSYGECESSLMPSLVPLRGGPAREDTLGSHARALGADVYHLADGLVRRASLDGVDEMVASDADRFEVGAGGVAWQESASLWFAPMSR